MDSSIPTSADPPESVLVVNASRNRSAQRRPFPAVDGDTAEIRVAFTQGPPLRDDSLDQSSTIGLVMIGDLLEAIEPDFDPTGSATVVEAVDEPTDLARIGLTISELCERWAETDQLLFRFHSLETLFEYNQPKLVFRFLHTLLGRLDSVDALSHIYLDPTSYDDTLAATFGTLFDGVVVDEGVEDPFTEATDDDVAEMLAEWTDNDDDGQVTAEYDMETMNEATDEDIAQRLRNY